MQRSNHLSFEFISTNDRYVVYLYIICSAYSFCYVYSRHHLPSPLRFRFHGRRAGRANIGCKCIQARCLIPFLSAAMIRPGVTFIAAMRWPSDPRRVQCQGQGRGATTSRRRICCVLTVERGSYVFIVPRNLFMTLSLSSGRRHHCWQSQLPCPSPRR